MPSRARCEQRRAAPGAPAVGREHGFDLPLTGGLGYLEGHDQRPVDVVGSKVGVGQVEPREGESGRAGERAVAAFPGAVAGELPGRERCVIHDDLGLAEGLPEVRGGHERAADPRTRWHAEGSAGEGLPADVNLP